MRKWDPSKRKTAQRDWLFGCRCSSKFLNSSHFVKPQCLPARETKVIAGQCSWGLQSLHSFTDGRQGQGSSKHRCLKSGEPPEYHKRRLKDEKANRLMNFSKNQTNQGQVQEQQSANSNYHFQSLNPNYHGAAHWREAGGLGIAGTPQGWAELRLALNRH